MSRLSINASVSIQILQPQSNIEIHVSLNRRHSEFNLAFGDLIIDLILAYLIRINFQAQSMQIQSEL